jgi:hypothetical protein
MGVHNNWVANQIGPIDSSTDLGLAIGLGQSPSHFDLFFSPFFSSFSLFSSSFFFRPKSVSF